MSKRSRRESDCPHYSSSLSDHGSGAQQVQSAKYTQLDSSASTSAHCLIRCSLPPHEPLSFDAYDDYEIHYQKSHTNRCSSCGRNFPTDHFLSLHIAETHDPLTALKRDRGDKTYYCFVEGCEKVCSTPQKRRMHLIDKHMFPKDYDFFAVNHGLDNRASMLRSEKDTPRLKKFNRPPTQINPKSASSTHDMESTIDKTDRQNTDETSIKDHRSSAKDVLMDDIAESMAALKFVPKSIAFGRGRQRAGFAKS